MRSRLLLLIAGAFLVAGPPGPATAQTRTLRYTVPQGWREEQPRSSMRLAQFALPRAAGDRDDAVAVIFYFGQGQGGPVRANLQRWAAQMTQADGKPGTVEAGATSTLTAPGVAVTVLDIGGSYTGESMMGTGTAQGAAKPGYHMKAAVIETSGGPYFLKVTGPAATLKRWDASLATFLKSLRYE